MELKEEFYFYWKLSAQSFICKLSTIFNIMDSEEKSFLMGNIKKSPLSIVGMHLIDFQTIYCSNFRGIRITMKIAQNHIKLFYLQKILVIFHTDILYQSSCHFSRRHGLRLWILQWMNTIVYRLGTPMEWLCGNQLNKPGNSS